MKQIFLFIYFLGVVLICTFGTPVKYYRFHEGWVVIHTNIFSDIGKILAGRWALYILIWSAFVILVYTSRGYMKSNRN